MDWLSFLLGGMFGAMLGVLLLAMLQFLRDRRDDGDDFVNEIEAMRNERGEP